MDPFSQGVLPGFSPPWWVEDILITVRAYPEPSTKYAETSCVAGVTLGGRPIRLFPVLARHLADPRKFSKYDVIRARVIKSTSDARPESHRIDMHSIEVVDKITTGKKRDWVDRNALVAPWRIADSIEALEERFKLGKQKGSASLALIRPREVLGLKIERKAESDWSDQKKARLATPVRGATDGRVHPPLEFIPYSFTYRFRCASDLCAKVHEFSIIDWEVLESYRSWTRKYGPSGWESAFRQKYEHEFLTTKDLQFFIGTVSSHPDRWTIIGLYYPPKT